MPLPKLTLNRAFMADFADADTPCFALGLVEVDGERTGFLALRPEETIPCEVLAQGFGFGHRLYGHQDSVLCQFVFDFYGFGRYIALVNPASPMVRHILEMMVHSADYHFFNLSPGNTVTAFRSEIGEENLAGMRDSLPVMQAVTTTDDQYEKGVQAFARNPDPPGTLMTWVCRDNPDYLDLTTNVLELPPLG